MSGWLSGVVKAVTSGDCLVIMGKTAAGPPPEKTLTLSSLIAPRLGRGENRDEAYAWDSREFLRKKVIGREVVFRVEYTVAQIGRDFGAVYLSNGPQKENVAHSVVSAGWARVRQGGGDGAPDIEQLIRMEEAAREAEVGIWAKETKADAVRDIPTKEIDSVGLLETNKGKPLAGIVEAVLNGSTLRVTLLPDFRTVTVFIGGIQCPSMGRRQAGADGEAAAEPTPEPHAREAKFFSETKVLHREIRIVLANVDKFGNLFGELYHAEGGEPVDLAEQLCARGLAKVVDWSAAALSRTAAEKLRSAEKQAKDQRTRIWTNYVPPPKFSTALSDKFKGKIVEVVSGDVVVVRDLTASLERRICLSSIRAPRLGNPRREQKGQPYAAEAKEFIRSRLIGKLVNVSMEYSRKIPPPESAPAGTPEMTMDFGTVTFEGGVTGEDATANIAEMLVVRGLASCINHRGDEERSFHYDALLAAEARAQKAKKGIHSNKEPPSANINDLSLRDQAARAKAFLPSFTRTNGSVSAMVDVVLSGHRVKLYIAKENVMIAFSLAGVRCPGKNKDVTEPYSDEALAFTRQKIMQHNVEVDIETCDKTGTFLGSLRYGSPRVSLATSLLEAGLGSIHPMFNPGRARDGDEMIAAEEAAKAAKLKIWENYSAEAAQAEAAAATGNSGKESFEVQVTEVLGGGQMYVQRSSDQQRVDELQEKISQLGLAGGVEEVPAVGSMCLGKFTVDDAWYRARVNKVEDGKAKTVNVTYVDFGNSETLPLSRVDQMDASVDASATPPLAQLVSLAYLKVPVIEDELGSEAAEYLASIVLERKLKCTVEEREKGEKRSPDKVLVSLADPTTDASVSGAMVSEGLARVQRIRSRRSAQVIEALKEDQESARKERLGMWQYGDADSDDERM
mmetsp:Transcript_31827/g.38496  ORF Transcript_31827/g.38496 Transcript_31827/m.38496 type:complete len:905 (-) Transcript_31827:461-3175(-)|eukprot:CAMPEP_0197853484 /NCGR_PEP_ID=MMETSP1438-20131217/22835_1 /TAXON_ID=1461541 /ORGANISM="Pterosperma sp., Strain CCMP1384" /LENGTH=904 /DNA_ID=CAMNT_0043467915 /DNA_START=115 /DNA_END=2829 /DNA_ORIENTATION=+